MELCPERGTNSACRRRTATKRSTVHRRWCARSSGCRRSQAETLVFPGHTAQPPRFDGQPLCASLGILRERLPLLQVEPSALVDHLLAHQPEPPAHFAEIVALNLAGAAIDDPEQLATLEAGANRCAVR